MIINTATVFTHLANMLEMGQFTIDSSTAHVNYVVVCSIYTPRQNCASTGTVLPSSNTLACLHASFRYRSISLKATNWSTCAWFLNTQIASIARAMHELYYCRSSILAIRSPDVCIPFGIVRSFLSISEILTAARLL